MKYEYLGDKQTDDRYRGRLCLAVRRKDGKGIQDKNSNMLVEFEEGIKVIVLARRLRKIK